jgi:UDP-N-acetylmuramoyl-L-alanyl-D-glutamate--2,6-diaminopimelate ligase
VLNADDPVSNGWLGNFSGPSFSYGLGSDNPVSARVLEQNACETIFLLQAGDDAAAVRTSLIGAHQIEHCLAAASAALWYGIDLTAIAQGIEAVTRLPGRMERVACGQDFPLFVDAARSADALRASLRTARQLAAGRVLCVLADAPPASSREALAIREVVRRHADVVILTEQRAELESCWNDVDDVEVHVAAERSEAIGWAVSMAQAGDAVVVTGQRPQDGFQFGGDAAAPSDADVARELLYARNAPALRLVA